MPIAAAAQRERLTVLPRAYLMCGAVICGYHPMKLHQASDMPEWVNIAPDEQGYGFDFDRAHIPDLIEAIRLARARPYHNFGPVPCEVAWLNDSVPDAVIAQWTDWGGPGLMLSPESEHGLDVFWPARAVPKLMKILNAVCGG